MEYKEEFLQLKNQLKQNILHRVKPKGRAGNPKLYLYGLREMAVIQYCCGESDEMLGTLEAMEKILPLDTQWRSRIKFLHSRARWRHWVVSDESSRDDEILREALAYSEEAFALASGLTRGIANYMDAKSLISQIKGSVSENLIDALESLVAYGDVQLGLRNFDEAIKSVAAVIEFSKDDNPRLLAMGYLVTAEAHIENGLFVEAHQHLVNAKALEWQIDHKYVEDRRLAVEKKMPDKLDLSGLTNRDFSVAEDWLLGWYIERHSHKKSVNQIATELGINRKRIKSYLTRLALPKNQRSPYRHLIEILKIKDKDKKGL